MERINTVAVVGNYLPRMCGIATFTTDVVTALSSAARDVDSWAIAMNDRPQGYRYPDKVRFEINQNAPDEYRLAADFLNINQVDVVCLQHEYGIFGGQTGSYILQLLRELRMPVVTTLHTVLQEPNPEQRSVLREIAEVSARVVVMAHRAEEFLTDIYDIPPEKIAFIHHGIPEMPFVDPDYYKDQFGVEGRRMILTFGLLSENKGIEYMIRALPRIVGEYPETVYVVLGATHPHIRKTQGEKYRVGLERLAARLGVAENVMFFNRFVEIRELCEFLGAADVYVTPYLGEAQIVSGTLAYAMGVGKATVSTPYWYAQEMVGEDRGVLVDFRDAEALGEAVVGLFADDVGRAAMRKRAYTFSRDAVWSQVAANYLALFSEAKSDRSNNPRVRLPMRRPQRVIDSLPELNFNHLYALTDDTGIIQHAAFSVPDYDHGYCIDDNARALMVAVTALDLVPEDQGLVHLQKRYLALIKHAYLEQTGAFRNFMGYDRTWLETRGSEDSQGRTLWGLGVCCALSREPGCVALSTTLFHRGLRNLERLIHPRALAFALVGIHAYLTRFSGDSEVRRIREIVAQQLFERFEGREDREWPWFDDVVTYANAKIPQALLLAGQWMQREEMLRTGFSVLDWLIEMQTGDGHFSPVGNAGWYRRGEPKPLFDQQPIEAQAMLEACLLAYRMTGKQFYQDTARKAFNWFLGQNDLNASLYDYTTGGCRDGLTPDGPNLNQGAESTLAWLLSLIAVRSFQADQKKLLYVERLEEGGIEYRVSGVE